MHTLGIPTFLNEKSAETTPFLDILPKLPKFWFRGLNPTVFTLFLMQFVTVAVSSPSFYQSFCRMKNAETLNKTDLDFAEI